LTSTADRERRAHGRPLLAATAMMLTTLVTLGVCEVLLRAALFSDSMRVPALRQAWRYADSDYEEDYWKLSYLFDEAADAPRVGRLHPTLGWLPASTRDNPLGILDANAQHASALERPILFYGDSFVAGVTPLDLSERLPQQLDLLTGERRVINLGVGGFGADQIYLRFRESVDAFREPVVIVGLLTDDLNRTTLAFRAGRKPYFDLVDGQLTLRNVPVTQAPLDYVKENPPAIRSYLWRLVAMRLREVLPAGWVDRWLGYDDIDERKRRISARLLEQFVEDARARGIRLRFALFYGMQEVEQETWQERFLKHELQALGQPYFDMKAFLSAAQVIGEGALDALYLPDRGHLNAAGNRVLARGLDQWLRELGDL
jgi:lysophospholipase L1-like esterase